MGDGVSERDRFIEAQKRGELEPPVPVLGKIALISRPQPSTG